MEKFVEIQSLQHKLKLEKNKGKIIGLITTKGYIHKGHEKLVEKLSEITDIVVVCLVPHPINPLSSLHITDYSANFKKDIDNLSQINPDIVFCPIIKDLIHPVDQSSTINSKSNSTITSKKLTINSTLLAADNPNDLPSNYISNFLLFCIQLFNIVNPDYMIMGQKDFSKIMVLKDLINILHFPVKIITHPMVRNKSGIAYNSQNNQLSEENLKELALFSNTVQGAVHWFRSGLTGVKEIYEQMEEKIKNTQVKIHNLSALSGEDYHSLGNNLVDNSFFHIIYSVDSIVFNDFVFIDKN